jgi:N-acetylglutamate synthase-like GNAT family acetyltransferase
VLDDEQVVGTIALIDIGNKQAALRKMFVKKDYRGKEKEVAKFLLNTLIHWCNQKVIQEIYLGTRAIFLAAQRFYEKNGFHQISKDTLPISFPLMQADSKFYIWRFDGMIDPIG